MKKRIGAVLMGVLLSTSLIGTKECIFNCNKRFK